MVADTYTSRLGLIIQGTGNNNNSWGDTFNNSFGAIAERAICGIATHTDTGGTLDLSASPPPAGPSGAIDYVQKFTGALASNLTVQMPNVQKTWLIDNSTSGSFSLFIRNGAAGGKVQIPQGCVRIVICDGAGGMKREDADSVGAMRTSAASGLTAGSLACNGASLQRADYPDLFGIIGTTWGSVDGTHFTLPNLQDTGRFMRSLIPGTLNVGNYQANLTASHTHTGTGTISGTTDNPGNHTHANSLTDLGHTHPWGQAGSQANIAGTGAPLNTTPQYGTTATNTGNNTGTPMSITNAAAGAHTHVVSGTCSFTSNATGGTETRPETIVVYVSILY